MSLNPKDLKFEYKRGQGPGGQHRNKTASCVKVTHIPTGISAEVDGRNQHSNKRDALAELERRLAEEVAEGKAATKKQRRDEKIKPQRHIRTYDLRRGEVTDHRSGKKARVKDILDKARLDLMQ